MGTDLKSEAKMNKVYWVMMTSSFFKLCLFKEKIIDLESDLEELQDSEQRWAAKHKRAIEQVNLTLNGGICKSCYSISYWHILCVSAQMEQLQLKLIQEKDLNDELETEKVVMERQVLIQTSVRFNYMTF